MKKINISFLKSQFLHAESCHKPFFLPVCLLLLLLLSTVACKKNGVDKLEPLVENVSTSTAPITAAVVKPVTTCLFKGYGGYCTDGAWEIKGKCIPWTGPAKDWYANAKAAGYTQSQTAIAGAIVVFPGDPINGNLGHVGVMVDATTMWSMNDICGWNTWTKRKVTSYPNSKKTIKPLGYIIDYKINANNFPADSKNCTK